MKYQTDDIRITGMEEVIAPAALIEEMPISAAASQRIFTTRQQISNMLNGTDNRLLVVIGPCSIHDPNAATDYAEKLKEAAEQYEESLLIVMRVYFEKPRTTVGWKGLINDPHLNNSYDINLGLRTARGVLNTVVELGLGTGTEYLDPITPQYLGDLVTWGAIGARTTESQIIGSWHRACRARSVSKTAPTARFRLRLMRCPPHQMRTFSLQSPRWDARPSFQLRATKTATSFCAVVAARPL